MDFLGNVNVFQGRVRDGRALLGSLEVAYPEYPHADEREATFYIRPHELDVHRARNGVGSLEARVQRVNPTGSVAKVALVNDEYGVDLNVELSLERYSELKLRTGDMVFVSPRKARAFMPEYVI